MIPFAAVLSQASAMTNVINSAFSGRIDNMQTTVGKNREVAKAYFDALGAGDMKRLSTIFADDIVWHQPGTGALSGTYRGLDEVFSLFKKFMERSDGSFLIDEVGDIMENCDLVSVVLHFSARRAGAGISMQGVDVMRIDNGKLAEVWLFSSDQEAEDRFWSD